MRCSIIFVRNIINGQLNGDEDNLANTRNGIIPTRTTVKHTEYSQSVETVVAWQIWGRSIVIAKWKLCYTIFIEDGDNKSYQQVCAMKPYGIVPIHKE